VRGSHYPQDQRFLDCCDEMGFLVFEESLGWGYDAELHGREDFLDANLRQTRLMVRNSFNHPSVILWGFLNEGGSHDPATRRLYESLVACVRDEDPSRPVTYATNRLWEGVGDRHLDLVDVVSLNMYPGWYARDHSAARPLGEVVPRIRAAIDEVASLGAGDKPLIVSEIGAGAIYGWRDPLMAHWSEEYQRDHLRLVCDEVVANSRIAGIALWQFCDSRTYATARALGRPRAFNNKGTFDEYRRPKLAAEAVKEAFARRLEE